MSPPAADAQITQCEAHEQHTAVGEARSDGPRQPACGYSSRISSSSSDECPKDSKREATVSDDGGGGGRQSADEL